MQLKALLANTLWSSSNLASYWRFCQALRDPQTAQWKKLHGYLQTNAQTAFGKALGFDRIRSYEEFARQVPVAGYDSFEGWIHRIRDGEPNVLTSEPVTHLVPTSGSTGARKLIPFTNGLQQEFNAAIGPWILDLQRQAPKVLAGAAYWSVTPAFQVVREEKSVVPIGFDSDTAYLGGSRRRLADAVMAVPSSVQRARTLKEFRFQTLLYLLRCRELRLISVWHPSFLTLLLDALSEHWNDLLDEIAPAHVNLPGSFVRRARELRNTDPSQPEKLWPKLQVISCWGDASAELSIAAIKRLFPNTLIQPKGLLATEAVVTIPFWGQPLLALASHFFEFLDAQGRIHLAHELQMGEEYEVIVTTSGGLCRYRLQDRVQVTGFLKRVPALRFLGRAGNICDRFGEKLSEAFVTGILHELTEDLPSPPRFALVAPDETQSGLRYTLYLEGHAPSEIAKRMDALLRENPHYSLCRDLGQLQPPRLFLITARGYETFAARELARGKLRLGDIKPCSLSVHGGWSNHFKGDYFSNGMR